MSSLFNWLSKGDSHTQRKMDVIAIHDEEKFMLDKKIKEQPERNAFKGCTGFLRIWNAMNYSREGFCAAYADEEAFRQIVWLCVAGIPLALLLGTTWAECIILMAVLFLSLMVELLNSAIENVVDYISHDLHPLAKKAKDMGSAAQCTAQTLIVITWGSMLIKRLFF